MMRASPPRLSQAQKNSWKTSHSLPGAPALWPLLAVLRRLDSANWSHMQLFWDPLAWPYPDKAEATASLSPQPGTSPLGPSAEGAWLAVFGSVFPLRFRA